ncbi:hypothetical protein GX586_05400 [bacterium]|nr:hypothetical protein [bacterium]
MKKRRSITPALAPLFPAAVLALSCAPVFAAGATALSPAASPTPSNITIQASKMEYLTDEKCVVLKEGVVVTLEGATLHADNAMAYQSTDSSGKTDFTRIVATGRVRIQTPERLVTAEKGVWERDKDLVRLTGDPSLTERGTGVMTADAIIYHISQRKVSFEGRVRARGKITDSVKKEYSGRQ